VTIWYESQRGITVGPLISITVDKIFTGYLHKTTKYRYEQKGIGQQQPENALKTWTAYNNW
jgi:hypothetical protein